MLPMENSVCKLVYILRQMWSLNWRDFITLEISHRCQSGERAVHKNAHKDCGVINMTRREKNLMLAISLRLSSSIQPHSEFPPTHSIWLAIKLKRAIRRTGRGMRVKVRMRQPLSFSIFKDDWGVFCEQGLAVEKWCEANCNPWGRGALRPLRLYRVVPQRVGRSPSSSVVPTPSSSFITNQMKSFLELA